MHDSECHVHPTLPHVHSCPLLLMVRCKVDRWGMYTVDNWDDCMGTGNGCMGTGNGCMGTGNGCMGTGNGCMGTGNDCMGTGMTACPPIPSYPLKPIHTTSPPKVLLLDQLKNIIIMVVTGMVINKWLYGDRSSGANDVMRIAKRISVSQLLQLVGDKAVGH